MSKVPAIDIDIEVDLVPSLLEERIVITVRGYWLFSVRLILTSWILWLAGLVAGVPLDVELSEDGRRATA